MVEPESLLKVYKLQVGLAADVLTFGGGLLLARDAFRHLKDVRSVQLKQAFRTRFPELDARVMDTSEDEAKGAVRVAYRGLILLLAGFACQILVRFAES